MQNFGRLGVIRPLNLILLALLLYSMHFLVNNLTPFHQSTESSTSTLYLTLSILFIAAGGNLINDYFDQETDSVNKPNKKYWLSRPQTLLSYVTLNIFGLISAMATVFRGNELTIFILTICLLFIYSSKLKRLPLSGNICISFLCSLPILLFLLNEKRLLMAAFDPAQDAHKEAVVITKLLLYYAIFAFLTSLIREIIKDLEDLRGDYLCNFRTLPIVAGIKLSKLTALTLLIFTAAGAIYFFVNFENSLTWKTIGIVGVVGPFFISMSLMRSAKFKSQFNLISTWLKISMLNAIVLILLFPFLYVK